MDTQDITGKTIICGVIGDPIGHTLSPVMHNAAFREMGIDGIYLPFRVTREALKEAIKGMRALNLRGLNVTIPHKEAVIPLLDRLDPAAESIGAVNTIVNDAGRLVGYNTDADGFYQALLESGTAPRDKNAVLLGAGGAARAIGFILAREGAHLTLVNRSQERARELARWLKPVAGRPVKTLALNNIDLAAALLGADLLVNATSVGMAPHGEKTPVPAELLKTGLAVFDTVYRPRQTRLLREAMVGGAAATGGIEMLIWQGALSFALWTGQKAPLEMMRAAALKAQEQEDEK
ncbi:MAG: shikimate dehydrogenase [Chloroflexota bacterium]